tara:strand:+ start:40 stop:543 length:504 start_codon:yes stop_codon:yes gene_type:complete
MNNNIVLPPDLRNLVLPSKLRNFSRLPPELQIYIYQYLQDDVKVYYWLDKYNWKEVFFELFKYYCETYIVEKFYQLCPCENKELLYDNFQYIIDKCYNSQGKRIKIEFWEFSPVNEYNNLHDDLSIAIEKYIKANENKKGIYKYMAECIYLHNNSNILCQTDDSEYL